MPQSQITKKSVGFITVTNPDSRFLEIKEFIGSPKYTKRKSIPKTFNEYQKVYIAIYRGEIDSEEDEETVVSVQKSYLLYSIPSCRAILNGLLISQEPITSVAEIIKESPDVIEAYASLFFDTSVFFNDLLKVAYIRSLMSDTDEDVFQKKVLSWGHYLGAKYIGWKIGSKSSTDMLPSQAVKKVLDDSIWRSSEHALEDIASARAKESRAWVPQVLRSAELLNNIETTAGMENALSELKIKLVSKEESTSSEINLEEIKG